MFDCLDANEQFSNCRYPIFGVDEINAKTAHRISVQAEREMQELFRAYIRRGYHLGLYKYESIEGFPINWHVVLSSPSGEIRDFSLIYQQGNLQMDWPLYPNMSVLYSLPDLFYHRETDYPIRVVANEEQVRRLKKNAYRNEMHPLLTTAGYLRPLEDVDWSPVGGRQVKIFKRDFDVSAHAGFDAHALADYLGEAYDCNVEIF